jgi:signal transduction histidine kinase
VVTVRARAGAKAVRIAVSDTGLGIPPPQLVTIWEPFVQGDGSDERQFGGVGLGLALVRRLCAALGAEIGVTSEVGKGSTFTVSVPCEWTGAPPTPDPAVGAGDRAPN